MASWFRCGWLVSLLFVSGCAFVQPLPPSDNLQEKKTKTVREQYPGPRYLVRMAELSPVAQTLDEILREHGFKREGSSSRSRTYLLPRAHHPMVDQVRVSFYYQSDRDSLHVHTRAEASMSTLLVFKSSFSDVSNRPQTVERMDALFRELERRLNTQAVRVAGPESEDSLDGL